MSLYIVLPVFFLLIVCVVAQFSGSSAFGMSMHRLGFSACGVFQHLVVLKQVGVVMHFRSSYMFSHSCMCVMWLRPSHDKWECEKHECASWVNNIIEHKYLFLFVIKHKYPFLFGIEHGIFSYWALSHWAIEHITSSSDSSHHCMVSCIT